jgi:hypothetical protein
LSARGSLLPSCSMLFSLLLLCCSICDCYYYTVESERQGMLAVRRTIQYLPPSWGFNDDPCGFPRKTFNEGAREKDKKTNRMNRKRMSTYLKIQKQCRIGLCFVKLVPEMEPKSPSSLLHSFAVSSRFFVEWTKMSCQGAFTNGTRTITRM